MRTINVKVAVIFLVGVIVIGGSTHLLHSFQVSWHSPAFKTQAYAFWNQKPRRYTDAIQCMKQYLLLEPNDLDATKDLGFWMAKAGQFGPATQLFEELTRKLEKRNDAGSKATTTEIRRKLAELEMTLGRWADAKAHLTNLLQDYPLAEKPETIDDEAASFLKLRGQCESALGDDKVAINDYKLALKNPANRGRVDIYYVMAMTYQYHLRNLPEARRCWVDMIGVPANEKSPGAHQSYGLWLSELGEYDAALEQAMATLKLKENHPGGLHLAGDCLLNLGRFQEAEEYAKKAMEASKESLAVYTLAANVYMRSNRRQMAIDVLKQGLGAVKSSDDKNQILWHLANLELDESGAVNATSIRDAEDYIQQLREFNDMAPKVKLLKARLLYANDDWAAALHAFEDLRPSMTEFPPLMKCLDYWIGYCYLQQGNPDQAEYAFRRALSYDKFYFKAHEGIAQIAISKGHFTDALDEYEQALAGDRTDPEVRLAYVRTLVQERLRRSKGEQDLEFVASKLAEAQKLSSDPRLDLLVAEVAVAAGKADYAQQIIEDLHRKAPQSAEFYVGLVNLDLRRGELDKARDVLDEARAKLGDRYLLRLARASLAVRELYDRAGPRLEELAQDLDAYSISEKTALLGGLLNDLMDIKDLDRAKLICQRLARLQPHDATVRYRLLELELATHNFRDPARSLAEVDHVLDEIESIAGRGPLWNYGKAVRLRLEYASENNPDLLVQAMNYASLAQRQRVDWSRPHVLEGEIARLRGDNEEALQHYLQASLLGDQDLDFIRLLMRMLFDKQRYAEAREVVRRLDANQVQVSPDIMRREAELSGSYGDLDRARELAKRAYNPNSGDYSDHLWYGQTLSILYRRAQLQGRRDILPEILAEAQQALQKAIEIAPSAPACRVELVQLLVTADRLDEARAAATAAEGAMPADVAPLALGYINDALGDAKKAAASYERAVALRPDAPLAVRMLAEFYIRQHDWQRAAPLIEKLLGGQLTTSEIDLVAARRMKAAMLAEQGYPKFKEALALIDQNLKSPLVAPQDLRFKAQILMVDPTTALGQEPLDLLTSLVEKGTSEPEPQDRYELARLHLRRDEWTACREQMEKLVNSPQCESRYLAAYAKLLLDRGQVDDAALWLAKFEQRCQPGEEIALHAEAMFRRNNWGELKSYLLGKLERENTASRDRRALLVAQLFEDFGSRLTEPSERSTAEGYFDEAARLFEICAKSGPDAQMTLAAFYARRGRVAAAVDLIARYAGEAAPGSVAVAAVTAASSENVKADELQKMEQVVAAAAAAHGEPLPLLTALGVLNISLGQTAKAEELYRRVVAKNPKDFHAYNNLALLLAIAGDKQKLDEALDLINHAMELAGPQPKLLDSRAVVRICRGEPGPALEDIELILADKAEQADPVWLFHKARALYAAGKSDAAAEVINNARNRDNLDRAKIDPPERPAYDRLMKDLHIAE